MNLQNQRIVYGETLLELGGRNENIVVLEADLGKSTMSCFFCEKYPDRYFQMGIAEANMVSFAAGLSLVGKIPFVNSFAVFAAGRPYDQIRQSVSIGRLNVKIIGSSSGLSDFGDGATHQCIEDIALMRAIPNMMVLSPCDGVQTKKMIEFAADYDGPVYIRLNRNPLPDIISADEAFELNALQTLTEGSDIVVFATGVMVYRAMKAANMLKEQGIMVKVVNVPTLKPFDDKGIIEAAGDMKGVVTVEEHSYIGGLASVVTYALKGQGIPIEVLAIDDKFGQSASNYEELQDHYNLNEENIIKRIKAAYKRD